MPGGHPYPSNPARSGTCPFVIKYRPRVERVTATTRERRRLKNVAVCALNRMQIAWVYHAERRYLHALADLKAAMADLGDPL